MARRGIPLDPEAAAQKDVKQLRRAALQEAIQENKPARRPLVTSILRERRIDAIQDMMAALNWSTKRSKNLAEAWGVQYNPYMKILAAEASKRLIREVSSKKDVKRDLCALLQNGIRDCNNKGRWMEAKGLADSYAKLVGLDREERQAHYGTHVQIVMPGGDGWQRGTTPAMKMLFKPREIVETTFEDDVERPAGYIEDPVERAIAKSKRAADVATPLEAPVRNIKRGVPYAHKKK